VLNRGGVTRQQNESPTKKQCSSQQQQETSPMDKAEELKEQGNQQIKLQNYLDAYDYYTDAILATPYGESIGLAVANLPSSSLESILDYLYLILAPYILFSFQYP